MTTVIFVRHGQSESNLAKVFTGQNEVSLTALGREQAQNTAQFLKDYPIFTKNRDSAPTRYKSGAVVENSFIADGCVIEGTVKGCVLFRGVHVAKGAVVENSILMQDTYVSSGTELGYVITDKNVVIKEKRKLFGCESLPFYIGKNSIL